MDHAATAFQAHHHFILVRGHGQQRSHFMTQVIGGRRLDVALEIQHEHPRLVPAGLLRLLRRLGFGLAHSLQLSLVQHRMLQALAQALVEVIELAYIQMAAGDAAIAPTQCGNGRQHHQDGHQHGDGPGQKACVLGKELHVYPPCNPSWRRPFGDATTSKHNGAIPGSPATGNVFINSGNAFKQAYVFSLTGPWLPHTLAELSTSRDASTWAAST
ncbi:hypothetical protein D9M68_494530 [compost metagenome]